MTPTCPTLERLYVIRPGERVTYYTGHLPDDIVASARAFS